MKKIIWIGAICSSFCFLFALVVYIVCFHILGYPLAAPVPPDMIAKINAINDIDHLRKLALLLSSGVDEGTNDLNNVFNSAVQLLITFSLGAGIMFLSNLWLSIKYFRDQQGIAIPWWLR